jgi:DNA repair protein RecO (recombination protein O)
MAAVLKRISDEPAYVLHRYDWSESSLILEVFTRHHGRIALVAKGAKKPSSSFRPVLLPLQAIQVAFGGDADIRALKSVEWIGGHVMPTGDALLSGYYLNELLLRLLAREDPHPKLFDAYAATVRVMATEPGELLQASLRVFELLLLREIGLLPSLNSQTLTMVDLDEARDYCLVPEGGLRLAHRDDRHALSGVQWLALQNALDGESPFTDTLRLSLDMLTPLRTQLRTLLNYHCGVGTLKTRQMMIDIQSL